MPRSARYHAQYVPTTWQYRYFGNFPSGFGNLNTAPSHGTEIPQVFGTYAKTRATPEQIESSKYIQGAWVAFAKDPASPMLAPALAGYARVVLMF